MRTARILKYLTYGVIILGIYVAIKFFKPFTIQFWVAIFVSVILWLILRVIANIGQIAYDIKAELMRALGNIERTIYHSNSIAKEIRDLIESDKDNENSSR